MDTNSPPFLKLIQTSGINMEQKDLTELAQQVKDACLKAFQDGFQEAGISGLCHEGAVEYAIDNVRSIDIDKVVATFLKSSERLDP